MKWVVGILDQNEATWYFDKTLRWQETLLTFDRVSLAATEAQHSDKSATSTMLQNMVETQGFSVRMTCFSQDVQTEKNNELARFA